MSIDTDFRTALTGHAALVALLPDAAAGIAQNAVGDAVAFPLVVFSVRTDTDYGLSGAVHAERAEIQVQCWADESEEAHSVADAVKAALVANAADYTLVTGEQDSFDPDLKKHAQILTVVWLQ